MSASPGTEPDYVVAHLEDALACDPRVSEQGLHVRVREREVFVSGTVTTRERREAVAEIVSELLPGYVLRNDATVTADYPEPEEPEEITE